MLIRLGLFLTLLFWDGLGLATENLLPARHYGTLQGLPDQAAMDIVQDDNQQIWISTSNGLSRFNGERFEVFRNQPGNDNSLLGNSISSIEMVGQEMWLLIEEMGLSRFNIKDKNFKHTISGNNDSVGSNYNQSKLLNSDVFAITSDSDGQLFIFQFNAGISVKPTNSNSLIHYTAENSPWLNSLLFFDAEIDENNQLWAVTLDGMALHWDLSNDRKQWFQVVDDERAGAKGLYDVNIDANNQVWLSGYAGVFRFDENKGQFVSAVSEQKITQLFEKHVSVRSSFHDQRGNLWLATLSGLLRYKQGELTTVSLMTSSQSQVKALYVSKVFEDHENNLWVLTNEHGVFVVGNQWQHQNIIPLTQQSDSIKSATLVTDGEKNALYLSHEFSPKIETIENTEHQDEYTYRVWQQNSNHSQIKPNVILADRSGLWIGGISGLYRQAYQKQTIQSIELVGEDAGKEFTVNHMLQGKQEDIWLHAHGLDQMWQIKAKPPHKQIAIKIKAADLVEMKWLNEEEMLLVHDHQLWSYHTQTQTWKLLFETPHFINNVKPEGETIWLVINGVLKLMHWQNNELTPEFFEWPIALNDFLIETISQDHLGRLWLSSDNGLVVFNPAVGSWRLLDTETGLPSPRVVAVFHKNDGSHWVVTSKGVVHLGDALFDTNIATPVLNIESIRLNNRLIESPRQFDLKHQYGLLQIEFALSSYNQPNSHRFEYRLTDQSPWQSTGQAQMLSFHDLTRGAYQLSIRGKSEQSSWSESKTLKFTVAPPWWLSQVAIISYVMGLVLIALLLRTLMRKRWLYRQTLTEALSRQQFAEIQLDLTSSLVGALETEVLLNKIKKVISDQVEASEVLVAFWNEEDQWSAFSEEIPVQQQLSLKLFAQKMKQNNQDHSFDHHNSAYFLTAWFNHSDDRFGFIQLSRGLPFTENDLVKAKACATQSSLALENARLFSAVETLAKKAQAANQAKNDFLAQVSHEVRTPMNGILGMNQLLMASELSQDQRQYTEAVAESGAHLLHIINDILDFSKIEAGQLILEHRSFNLLDLLDDMLNLFSATAKQKGLLFYLNIQSEITTQRFGDVTRIKQILMNLLSNAFKFTQKGRVVLAVKQQGSHVVFSVKDSGTGISKENQGKLFAPFTQADSSITRTHGGTGLGLSIVKQLSELMDGHVLLESVYHKGSQFSAFLDLAIDFKFERSSVVNAEKTIGIVSDQPALALAIAAQCAHLGLEPQVLEYNKFDSENGQYDDLICLYSEKNQSLTSQLVNGKSLRTLLIALPEVTCDHQLTVDNCLRFPIKTSQLRQFFFAQSEVPQLQQKAEIEETAPVQKQVLVLEDNAINQELMRHLLEKAGHVVHLFDHANQAINALKGGISFDLMLVDYHLPDVNGVEFIDHARQSLPEVPCAILTADVSDQLLTACHEHHIHHVFTKPLDLDQLQQLMKA